MTFKKGQSGNPSGRPPKERTFALLLERALGKKFNGIPKKKLWLEHLADALATGRIQFPDEDKPSIISLETWANLSFKTLAHIEPPPREIDITTGGDKILVEYVNPITATDPTQEPDTDPTG